MTITGKQLKKNRLECKLTQKELAKFLEMHESQICRYENSRHGAKIRKTLELALIKIFDDIRNIRQNTCHEKNTN